MAIKRLFSVYDSKAEVYGPPVVDVSSGAALRGFADVARNKDNGIGMHPEDYILFEIGTFDDNNCRVKLHDAKVSLATAIDLLKPQDPELTPVKGLEQVN